MSVIENVVSTLNNFMYSYLLIYMLIGISFFTIRTRFVQFRMIPEMFRDITEKEPVGKDGKKGISSFQAFTITLCFGFVFNAVQANTISIAFNESFGVSRTVMA